MEKFNIRFPIAATQTIPDSRELAVVEVEIEVVHSMAGGTVDDGGVRDVFAVMNQDSPDVDEDKKEDIGKFLQGEQEGENVVGDTLSVAVDGVEGMGGVRAWHNPFVVGLMQVLIDEGVVKAAVDPVDEEVGEDYE